MAVAKSLAKISFFLHGRHGPRGCGAFRIFSKKFRLIREIRVPTGFIPDFAQVMLFIRRSLEDG